MDHPAVEAAHLVHQSRERLRLRVPTRRHDTGWLDTAAAALRLAPGVRAVRSCAATGCLTLYLKAQPSHSPGLAAQALAAAGIRLAGCAAAEATARSDAAGGPSPASPRAASAGLRADRRTLALALFLLLLGRHLVRSGWLAPGLALAWLLWERLPMRRRALRPKASRRSR